MMQQDDWFTVEEIATSTYAISEYKAIGNRFTLSL